MTKRSGPPATSLGMTLIELLIVLVIVAILAAVAWPSFRDAVQKSRRADAMSALTEIMQAQERWRANHPQYTSSRTDLGGTRATSANGHYAMDVAVLAVDGTNRPLSVAYQATATAKETSPQYSDSTCRVMRVTIDGGNIRYLSLASGGAENSEPDPCWAR